MCAVTRYGGFRAALAAEHDFLAQFFYERPEKSESHFLTALLLKAGPIVAVVVIVFVVVFCFLFSRLLIDII